MIVHNSTNPWLPKSRKTRLWILLLGMLIVWLMWGIPSNLLIIITSDETALARVGSFTRTLVTYALIIFPILEVWKVCRRSRRRHRIIVTQRTLAIQTAGTPAVFVKREDCQKVADSGRTFLVKGGERMELGAEGASDKSIDAFLERLYALWWPGLNFAEVKIHSEKRRPSGWMVSIPCFATIGILIANHQIDILSPYYLITIPLGAVASLVAIIAVWDLWSWWKQSLLYRVQPDCVSNDEPACGEKGVARGSYDRS